MGGGGGGDKTISKQCLNSLVEYGYMYMLFPSGRSNCKQAIAYKRAARGMVCYSEKV